MSFRTLKFGDRTISYDTGLNLVDASGRGKKSDLKIMTQRVICHNDDDDGINNRSNRRIFDEMDRLYDSLVARHFLQRTQL